MEAALPERTRVAIVGSGFSGLGMAIRLKQEGIHDFVVLERAADVGGTWRDNTYPGCRATSRRCSTRSRSRPTRSGPAATRCRRRSRPTCAAARGRTSCPHIRFDAEVQDAAWDEDAGAGGSDRAAARSPRRCWWRGVGGAERAGYPRHPGLEDFDGHDVALRRLGPRPRPVGRAGGGARHRRVGDPVRPRIQPRRPAPAPVPAHPALGAARPGRPVSRREKWRLPPRPAGCSAGAHRDLLAVRADRAGPDQGPAAGASAGRRGAGTWRRQVPDPEAAGQAHAQLHDGLQADPHVRRLLPGARASPTRRW